MLGGGLLLACQQPESAAVRYARALTEAADYAEAKALCLSLEDQSLRADCQVSAMEAWDVVDEAECKDVSAPVWFDECLFLLAERQRISVDLDTAIDTCNRTRFARKCAWHLVQDEAQASLEEPPAQAELRLAPFVVSRPVPDAAEQFWFIRFQELAAAKEPVTELDCQGLKDPVACQAGIQRYVRMVLDALGRHQLEKVCQGEPGERAKRGGEPAWYDGPIAHQEEASWVDGHCTRRPVGRIGDGPAPETLPLPPGLAGGARR